MKTAITMNPDAPPEQLIETVQLAEVLGFDYVYVADQGFSRDIYVTLTALARATGRIHLGPGITHPYTRHPVAAAVAIATLDELSGGRAFLGLGAGGSRTLGPLQIPRTRPLQMCRETAEIARLLWREKVISYQGDFFQVNDAQLNFPCRPDIELHWAARGPKMLALGGELADVVLLNGIPRFDLANVVANIQKGARAAGRTARLQYAAPLVYDDLSRETARMRTAYRLVDSTPQVKQTLQIDPDLEREIRRLVTTRGPQAAAHLVSDDVLHHFVLEGDIKICAETLQDLRQTHNLDGVTVEVPNPGQAEDLLRRAAEIIGRL